MADYTPMIIALSIIACCVYFMFDSVKKKKVKSRGKKVAVSGLTMVVCALIVASSLYAYTYNKVFKSAISALGR